jgi:hypothetical protein
VLLGDGARITRPSLALGHGIALLPRVPGFLPQILQRGTPLQIVRRDRSAGSARFVRGND